MLIAAKTKREHRQLEEVSVNGIRTVLNSLRVCPVKICLGIEMLAMHPEIPKVIDGVRIVAASGLSINDITLIYN